MAAGACYVKYEVVLKNASGCNEYSNSGYNIGEMTICSFLTFSSVTDVQLTVSFKSTSRIVTAKVSKTPLTTPTPTPLGMTSFCTRFFHLQIGTNQVISKMSCLEWSFNCTAFAVYDRDLNARLSVCM